MPNNRLLRNAEFLRSCETQLGNTKNEILLISAFLRSEVLVWLSKFVAEGVSVSVVSRWRADDLLSGASDLESYRVARANRWSFFIDDKLHAKALLCDSKKLFLGSANFTSRGTHLFGDGNNELSIAVDASPKESLKVKEYLDAATFLTRPMFRQMEAFLESHIQDVPVSEVVSWPDDISVCISRPVDKLWVEECLFLSPSEYLKSHQETEGFQHDFGIFGTRQPSVDDFSRIRLFGWLKNLIDSSNEELRFGFVSAALHNALINDPKPYRKDVKLFVKVLFEWVAHFRLLDIQHHAFTKSLRVISNES